jgi:hypothetical protein
VSVNDPVTLNQFPNLLSDFQNLSGRIPWVAIQANNDTHIVKKSQRGKYTLDDPSRMAQKAVLRFLSHWHDCQEAGKQWPLRFLNPECWPTGQDEWDSAGRGAGGSHEGKGVQGDRGHNGEANLNVDAEGVDGGEEANASRGYVDENTMRIGTGEGGQNGRDEIVEMPFTPAHVDTMYRSLIYNHCQRRQDIKH